MNVRDRATGLKMWVNTTVYMPDICQIFGITQGESERKRREGAENE